jgi:hypothetical protein
VRRALAFLLIVIGVLALSSITQASAKFSYSESVDSAGNLSVGFDEVGQKRFSSVDYGLSATAVVTWSCNGQTVAQQQFPTGTGSLTPDERGRAAGTITLTLNPSGGSGCSSAVLARVDYTDVTLTNLSSGHVYRLDPVSQTF